MICRTILNETSYFGKGAIKEIANEVINRGLKKVMLVTDKDLLKFFSLCIDGKLPLERLLEKIYTLDQINEALDNLENRLVIRPLIQINPNLEK